MDMCLHFLTYNGYETVGAQRHRFYMPSRALILGLLFIFECGCLELPICIVFCDATTMLHDEIGREVFASLKLVKTRALKRIADKCQKVHNGKTLYCFLRFSGGCF